ncbi:MAG TPA: hypothetical protein DCW90_23900 [Lachnospiraceae bacterium]|nr:hypothetical protein [Lachnospiraceae bacterium]
MFIVSDKENKLMDVVDVYIKAMKDKDSNEVVGYMLMGIPLGSSRGQILAIVNTYEEAQKLLLKIAAKVEAAKVNDLD